MNKALPHSPTLLFDREFPVFRVIQDGGEGDWLDCLGLPRFLIEQKHFVLDLIPIAVRTMSTEPFRLVFFDSEPMTKKETIHTRLS